MMGTALSGASSMAGAASSGGYTTNADMLKTDAEIREWSGYGGKVS